MDLTIRHSAFTKTQTARTKSRDLFAGSEAVRGKGETYLFKEKNEAQSDYDLRLKRAVVDPYVEKIVGARQSLLFAKPHSRELPPHLDELKDNVDLKGTDARTFFSKVSNEAQIDGVCWVAIDMPRIDEPLPSAKAEREAGVRPFFEIVPANNVVDWEVGPDRQLLWAVIEQNAPATRMEFGVEREAKAQWKVWTRTEWFIFEESSSEGEGGGDSDDGPTLVAQGANPTGVVSLVPFYGIPDEEDFAGWPVAASVLDHIILAYNKASDLDWFERLTSHPIPYVIGPNKPEKMDANKGLWAKSEPAGGTVQIGYLETQGSAFGSLRESINAIEAKIYAIALAQAKRDSAQVQSGDSQREDRKIFSSSLKSASVRNQNAEQRCWAIMSLWMNKGVENIEIEYSRDFDDKTIEATMITALAGLADGNRISNETLLRVLKDGEVIPDDIDIDEELDKVRQQDAASAAETLTQLREVPRSA